MRKALILFALSILFFSYSQPPKEGSDTSEVDAFVENVPKNIILIIGNGMGLTQISAGMYNNGNRLNLEAFPVAGLHKTHSANNLITDSAAGTTAIACGIKTYNSAIGVDKDSMPVKNILEELQAMGLASGLVTTSSITQPTPAAFFAHVKSESMREEIAEQFLKTEFDFFVGGGKQFFDQREKDKRNLFQELKDHGYFISSHSETSLRDVPIDFDQKFAFFTADNEPGSFKEGRDYLTPSSRLAPVFLKKRSNKGFFLIIEGSKINWGGQNNDLDLIISEMIEFDQAIGEALSFAKEDGETLVVVTGNHETGGLSINQGSRMNELTVEFTTDQNTATLIPVFAYGPGSKLFSGIYENTAIYNKMRQAMGLVNEK